MQERRQRLLPSGLLGLAAKIVMADYKIVLSNLISSGTKTGQLTDSEIIQALGDYEDVDINQVYETVTAAGIVIVPGKTNLLEEPYPDSCTPEQEWDGGSMDSVSMYMKEIGQYPLLMEEEEKTLCQQLSDGRKAKEKLESKGSCLSNTEIDALNECVKLGEKAKRKLIEHNLRLVVAFAHKYEGQHHDLHLLDLIQSGNMGLMKGIERFDVEKGFRLSTYVTWWIKQAITRDIANEGLMIRVPVHASEKIRKLMAIERRLEQEQGCAVTDEQLAEEADISVDEVNALRSSRQNVVSIDAPVGDEPDGMTLSDMLPDEIAGPEAQYEQLELKRAVHEVMDEILTPKERFVVIRRWGMYGYSEHTLSEVGNLIGVTRERVRQIELRAVRKLRATGLRRRYIDFVQVSNEEL